jgi:hypothetical protein
MTTNSNTRVKPLVSPNGGRLRPAAPAKGGLLPLVVAAKGGELPVSPGNPERESGSLSLFMRSRMVELGHGHCAGWETIHYSTFLVVGRQYAKNSNKHEY